MAMSKTFFEQIPIETVKRIATESPEEDAIVSDADNTETPDEVRPARQSWRELAQKIQHERDSERMIELVEQLLRALETRPLGKHPTAQAGR